MNILVFFNNKGGVGKTSLVYHIAWMLSEMKEKVLVADLDPQANLTNMFLTPERLEHLWDEKKTVYNVIKPMMDGDANLISPQLEKIANGLNLLVGDLKLSQIEDDLSDAWSKCLDGKKLGFSFASVFYRVIKKAAEQAKAKWVLVDIGPNLGAINRTAILAADYLVIPLAPDLYSLQGLKNLGPTLKKWQEGWESRLKIWHEINDNHLDLPSSKVQPLGYVLMQYTQRTNRPVKAYIRWMEQTPKIYNQFILNTQTEPTSVEKDPNCLAKLKNYHSLMPLAMEAHKPMFLLTPKDGAIGAHTHAVSECKKDFKVLTKKILNQIEGLQSEKK